MVLACTVNFFAMTAHFMFGSEIKAYSQVLIQLSTWLFEHTLEHLSVYESTQSDCEDEYLCLTCPELEFY